jgi:hypothetical protein
MAVVEVLDGLFEADSNEQTDDDSGEVDKEGFPSMDVLVRSVNVEHRR